MSPIILPVARKLLQRLYAARLALQLADVLSPRPSGPAVLSDFVPNLRTLDGNLATAGAYVNEDVVSALIRVMNPKPFSPLKNLTLPVGMHAPIRSAKIRRQSRQIKCFLYG